MFLFLQILRVPEPIDLAAFPKLIFLRIHIPVSPLSIAIGTLSTISPSDRLREVVIQGTFGEPPACTEIDSILSRVLLHTSVSVELVPRRADHDPDLTQFPQLSARNIVRPSNLLSSCTSWSSRRSARVSTILTGSRYLCPAIRSVSTISDSAIGPHQQNLISADYQPLTSRIVSK